MMNYIFIALILIYFYYDKNYNKTDLITNENSSNLSIKDIAQKHNIEFCPKLIYSLNKWQENQYITDDKEYLIIPRKLSLLTYNIWFDKHNWTNRVKSIINILEINKPDIVCLQEVTNKFKNELLNNKIIQENYVISNNKLNYYDVLILVKVEYSKWTNFYYYDFQKFNLSRMGRKLLIAEISFKITEREFENLIISTAHFESLYDNYQFRAAQLKKAFDIITSFNNSFIMGDFNYDPSINFQEEMNINSLYKDTLIQFLKNNKEMSGIDWTTYPQEDDIPPTRLDRIYYNKNSFYEIKDFKLVGVEFIEIGKDGTNGNKIRTPSDHKGIYSEFFIEDI